MAADADAGAHHAAPATKAPPWHGWVVGDMFFSSLSAGTFAVAALGDLLRPADFAALVPIAYAAAFLAIVADLVCLIFDLGDPMRFHHMLRTFKPRSPMSLGTWSIAIFSILCFVAAALALIPISPATIARRIVAMIALGPALAVMAYKGVLFSATAQPGWKDARWLGALLAISSATLGCALLLALAELLGLGRAAIEMRIALLELLPISMILTAMVAYAMSPELADGAARGRRFVAYYSFIAIAGLAGPLVVIILARGPAAALVSLMLIAAGALALRHHLVTIPHRRG